MPDPGPGSETFFYTNQQSARLMFYHDHSYGITRLNVYAGEAAGYLLTDAVEQDLITRGILPATQIPLIIQDKTFIDTTTILKTDPTVPSNFVGRATVTGTTAQVVLSWVNTAQNATGFVMERSTNPGFTSKITFSLPVNTLTLTQSNLARRTTYYYRLKSLNTYGASLWVSLTVVMP